MDPTENTAYIADEASFPRRCLAMRIHITVSTRITQPNFKYRRDYARMWFVTMNVVLTK
jgi:hypothetical protein